MWLVAAGPDSGWRPLRVSAGNPFGAAITYRASAADFDGVLGGLAVTICRLVEQSDVIAAGGTAG
ncbi:hypothetical protein KV112_02690 [Mycolicibacter sp. MYC123]|uniref:Uncharacterized protein n=1 Tax=[Mycobacterium] zoologicum TaxID=2872311 RepID=A0ABU5YGV3_9MYCO|nr:hypothetical protein [Mycolicibacter sp. MYC123]MEB3048654.1 hypothetical protein [Mycolicibacter sp. MYC123]